MIKLNLNITNKQTQTGTYQEWLNHINHNPIYNKILNQLIQHIKHITKNEVNKKLINRILSFYLLPQNHNNLDFGSLHQFDKQIKTSIHQLAIKDIIISHFHNYNTYYKFSEPIEQFITRLYNLEILTHESNKYTT